jgi:hypothetical protein
MQGGNVRRAELSRVNTTIAITVLLPPQMVQPRFIRGA